MYLAVECYAQTVMRAGRNWRDEGLRTSTSTGPAAEPPTFQSLERSGTTREAATKPTATPRPASAS
eukprot:scaffold38679_cov65-Phaeocystis_antarctica.AAC.3